MLRIWEAVRFRWQRMGNFWNTRYWAALIRRRGGTVGSGFLARKGALIDIAAGGRVSVGRNVMLAENVAIYVGPDAELKLGDRCFVGRGTVIVCNEKVEIGEGTQIAHRTTLIDSDHRFDSADRPVADQGGVYSPVIIGKEVWIGAQAIVLKGVTIGDRGVVGAGSVVTRSVNAGEVVVGNPARPRTKS